MGLTYKVLKYHNIEMDLTKPHKHLEDEAQNLALTAEELDDDKPSFTAEHILQLCRFLAEKSQAKKNRQQLDQLTPSELHHPTHYSHTSIDYDSFEPARPSQSTTTYCSNSKQFSDNNNSKITTTMSHVLLDKLSGVNCQYTSIQQSATITNTNCQQQQQHQLHYTQRQTSHNLQDKREILRKIRQQIFERQRLRHLVRVQEHLAAEVWRPW